MNHSGSAADRQSPWPGPRPYREDEAHLFHGRRLVVDQLLNDAVYGARISLLCAASGSGKTSLLMAGLLPELRQRRALREDVPPAIVLREWGAAVGQSVEEKLAWALSNAGTQFDKSKDAIAKRIERKSADDIDEADLETMRTSVIEDAVRYARCLPTRSEPDTDPAAKPTGDAFDPIAIAQRLCQEFGCVFLILDQLEELMGSGSQGAEGDRAGEVADVVGRLFRDCPEAQLVLAWRTEYYLPLVRHLNRYVTNLSRRLIDLERLPATSVQDVIRAGAQRLCRDTASADTESFVTAMSSLTDLTAGGSLLELQAVLIFYFEWHADQLPPPAPSGSSLQNFLEYAKSKGAAVTDGDRTSSPLLRAARQGLDQFVNWSIESASERAAESLVSGDDARRQAALMARWIVFHLVPKLATEGGFKQHARLSDMLLSILEVAGPSLGLSAASLAAAKTDLGQAVKHTRRPIRLPLSAGDFTSADLADGVGVKLLLDVTNTLRDDGVGAGPNLPPAGRMICALLNLTDRVLSELVDKNLLKLSGHQEHRRYELVHDGFARRLTDWRGRQENKADLSCGSPIPIRGEQFRWTRLGGKEGNELLVTGVRWVGVALGQAVTNNEPVLIEHVIFEGCSLRGTFFSNCKFTNVTFRRCVLTASVFIEDFEKASADRQEGTGTTAQGSGFQTFKNVVFEACDLRSCAFINCTFKEGVQFKGSLRGIAETVKLNADDKHLHEREVCDLTTVSFERCATLSGPVRFDQCILRFAQIRQFNEYGGEAKLEFRGCDLMNAWVWDAGFKNVVVDEGCRTMGMLSYDLPPAAWLERGAWSGDQAAGS